MVAERVAREATVVEEMAVASVAEGALAVATEVAVAAEGGPAGCGGGLGVAGGWEGGGIKGGGVSGVCLAVLEEGTARVEALLVAEVGPRVEEVPWAGDSGGDGEGGA